MRLLILSIFLSGCTGQTLMVPVSVDTKAGTFVHSAPIFRNSGNMTNVNYAYRGSAGSVHFHADTIDNAVTTGTMWEGMTKFGRAVIQPAVVGAVAAPIVGPLAGFAH